MRNIILIGMPGCGKSTVGVVLAKALMLDFIDSDLVIQRQMQQSLSDIITARGDDGFRRVEEEINASLQVENTVVATGGSVIYGPKAMEHLKAIGTVIYLQLDYAELESRLGDLHARGVTMKPGMTLKDLYRERCPLYEHWADITIDCNHKQIREIVASLSGMLPYTSANVSDR